MAPERDPVRGGHARPGDPELPLGRAGFWGDAGHYEWFTIHASPEPLECAFLALRHWAFKQLDAGRPVDELIRAVVDGNNCYGVLGLALALALETLHVSETVLPVVTCQRLWHDDLRRYVQEDLRGIDLLGLGLQPRLEGDRAAAKAYLNSRQSRRRQVRHLAMRFATGADAALGERFAGLLARFPDALPYTTEAQRDDARVTASLSEQARRWAELGEVENYRQIEVDGEPRGIAFQSPSPRTEQEERQLESSEAFFEEIRLIEWATQCLHAGKVVEGESLADAIRVVKERDSPTLFEERRDAEHYSPQTAVSAVAAAALLDEALSASDREWAWDVMAHVATMREPASARPGSRMPWHPAGHLVAALACDRRGLRGPAPAAHDPPGRGRCRAGRLCSPARRPGPARTVDSWPASPGAVDRSPSRLEPRGCRNRRGRGQTASRRGCARWARRALHYDGGCAAPSPHFSPGAVMIAEDFGPVRVLATESIAGTTVEGARARTGPKDPRGRGQRSPHSARWSVSRSTS